jgi:hypothetical protein
MYISKLTKPNTNTRGLSFIHIPKTAGSSLNRQYTEWDWNIGHHTMSEFRRKNAAAHMFTGSVWPQNYDECVLNSYRFSVVRNPYDRMKSWYSFVRKYEQHIFPEAKEMTFEDFIINPTENIAKERALWSLTDYLYYEGELDVHKIIRFENFNNEIVELFKSCNYDLNIGEKKQWDSNSDEVQMSIKARDFIAEKYSDDFINFNYEK